MFRSSLHALRLQSLLGRLTRPAGGAGTIRNDVVAPASASDVARVREQARLRKMDRTFGVGDDLTITGTTGKML